MDPEHTYNDSARTDELLQSHDPLPNFEALLPAVGRNVTNRQPGMFCDNSRRESPDLGDTAHAAANDDPNEAMRLSELIVRDKIYHALESLFVREIKQDPGLIPNWYQRQKRGSRVVTPGVPFEYQRTLDTNTDEHVIDITDPGSGTQFRVYVRRLLS